MCGANEERGHSGGELCGEAATLCRFGGWNGDVLLCVELESDAVL